MSNMTVVEGDTGVIVIDPLISAETAKAALTLYREHRGDRPVTAVIYTHAHIDHFGGVLDVVDRDTDVPIIAPEHFLEHAVSENVYAGAAMLRRGMYYSADSIAKGPKGNVGIRLGAGGSKGAVGLIAPTHDITHTGQEEILDGVRIVFQMTPGTESPAEMNGSEIAEMIEMPPALAKVWHTHGYYGSVSHNVKAIFQRYLGWYDGNPAHLWTHPPEKSAARYIEVIGGIDATLSKAADYAEQGDLRCPGRHLAQLLPVRSA